MVDIQFKQKFKETLDLKTIKQMTSIEQIGLVKKANRLSIMPVQKHEFDLLLKECLI
jgi:predicted RNA-binding protein with PUA-like domain